nr:hypothetical protein [Micromonospora provocatoris]
MAAHPRPSGYVAGVDLGGTKLRAALADLDGLVVDEQVQPTDPRGGTAVAAQIDALLRELAVRAASTGPTYGPARSACPAYPTRRPAPSSCRRTSPTWRPSTCGPS